jgi:hypothetical protein
MPSGLKETLGSNPRWKEFWKRNETSGASLKYPAGIKFQAGMIGAPVEVVENLSNAVLRPFALR